MLPRSPRGISFLKNLPKNSACFPTVRTKAKTAGLVGVTISHHQPNVSDPNRTLSAVHPTSTATSDEGGNTHTLLGLPSTQVSLHPLSSSAIIARPVPIFPNFSSRIPFWGPDPCTDFPVNLCTTRPKDIYGCPSRFHPDRPLRNIHRPIGGRQRHPPSTPWRSRNEHRRRGLVVESCAKYVARRLPFSGNTNPARSLLPSS